MSDRYEIEICLEEIRGRVTDAVWSWDETKQLVMARLQARPARQCRKVLSGLFVDQYGARRFARAPETARLVAGAYGGLRATQRLWIADVRRESGTFVLWWPWNDGENVSLRIGLYSRGATRVEDRAMVAEMKRIFAVH